MGIFKRQIQKVEEELPPVPEDEVGEVQTLAALIWENEAPPSSWVELREAHEIGNYPSATDAYRKRIDLANKILERYQPRQK